MQLDAELTTPDYKSIFQSSAFFISRTFHFLQRGIIRYVEIRCPNRSEKIPTRRFDGGNKGSRLRTSRNTIFEKYILLDVR